MDFDCELEKERLKKKLILLVIIFIVMMILTNTVMKTSNLGWSIVLSLAFALMLYVPGRIKERFQKGWLFRLFKGNGG